MVFLLLYYHTLLEKQQFYNIENDQNRSDLKQNRSELHIQNQNLCGICDMPDNLFSLRDIFGK